MRYRAGRWWPETERQIVNGGNALNRLTAVVTGTGVQLQDISCPPGSLCQSCHATVTPATTFAQNSHRRNNAACRVATFARHPSLGSAFISSQTFDFEALKHLSINPYEVTPVNWALLEAALLRARQARFCICVG